MNSEEPFIVIKNHRKRQALAVIDIDNTPHFNHNIKYHKWNPPFPKSYDDADKENL